MGEAATGLRFWARAGLEYHMPAVLDCEEPLKVSEEGEQGAVTVSRVDNKEAEKQPQERPLASVRRHDSNKPGIFHNLCLFHVCQENSTEELEDSRQGNHAGRLPGFHLP